MTSRERYVVSNNQSVDCLFKRSYIYIKATLNDRHGVSVWFVDWMAVGNCDSAQTLAERMDFR